MHSSPYEDNNTRPKLSSTKSTSVNDSSASNPSTRQANFRVVVTNVDGARGKQAEIEHLCDYMDPDVIIMCETKIVNNVNTSEILPHNYSTCFRKDRTEHGGGVLIAMKSHYVAEEVELIDINCEVVWAKIVLQNCSPMFVGSFYRPPSDNISSMESFDKSLQQVTDMCRNNTKATIIVAGDYNTGDIDWDLCHVNANSSKNLICQKLIDTFNEYGLTQLQKLPTRGEALCGVVVGELKWSGGWSTGTVGWLSTSERGQYLDGWPAMNTKCLVPIPLLPDLILWSTENCSHGSPVLVPSETQ